jgi:hypothetical protein
MTLERNPTPPPEAIAEVRKALTPCCKVPSLLDAMTTPLRSTRGFRRYCPNCGRIYSYTSKLIYGQRYPLELLRVAKPDMPDGGTL